MQPIRATVPWLEYAVFGLDRWLRRRQGVYEYCTHQDCLFRIQRAHADEAVILSDGTRIVAGAPLLVLHLWNEHMPVIAQNGATIAWARTISRAIDRSLRDLARYLANEPALDDVVALRADMRLGAADDIAQLVRIAKHYGFEEPRAAHDHEGTLHRFGDNILIFLLVMATNPAAIRVPSLSRDYKPVYLSRAALERRYGGDAGRRARDGRPC